jgi:hypothetical protein
MPLYNRNPPITSSSSRGRMAPGSTYSRNRMRIMHAPSIVIAAVQAVERGY